MSGAGDKRSIGVAASAKAGLVLVYTNMNHITFALVSDHPGHFDVAVHHSRFLEREAVEVEKVSACRGEHCEVLLSCCPAYLLNKVAITLPRKLYKK